MITPTAMADHKISLHGPDPDEPLGPVLKFGPDSTSGNLAGSPKNSVFLDYGARLEGQLTFPGKIVKKGVRHVLRMRWAWDMFTVGAPSEALPKPSKHSQAARALTVPGTEGTALDVDFYLSDNEAYLPTPTKVKRAGADMGPLSNSSGQYLTAVSHHHWLHLHPSHESRGEEPIQLPAEVWKRRRARRVSTDPRGFLLIEEKWVPLNENAG